MISRSKKTLGDGTHWQATPSGRIGWALNLGLEKNLLARIILSNYRPSLGVEILWRWPRGLRLGDPVRCALGEILLIAHFFTPINISISTCCRPSRESLTMSYNISPEIWRVIVWTLKNPDQKVVSMDYRESNSIRPLSWPTTLISNESGGRFKNAYELLNPRALKISMLYRNHIFQCMGKIFCVEFQRVPLKFHTKYLTHTLKDVDFIHRWKFKSS